MILPSRSFSQDGEKTPEVPEFQLKLDQMKDLTVQNYRNSVMTVPGIVEIQSFPNNIVRIKAKSPGVTIVHIWDSTGRKTYRFEVTNFAQSGQSNYRPGYNPQGSEFSYHSAMNNQIANGNLVSPFWNHDFTASVPINKNNEWRTLLSATTNPNGLPGQAPDLSFAPYSSSTYPSQLLSYYRTQNFTGAIGDVNYNPGELSVTGFPLRGASFELYENNNNDHLEVFAGANRPQLRTSYLFNEPPEKLYGFSGGKEILPNIILKTSFVYLDEPSSPPLSATVPIPVGSLKNDFVADIGIEAHPLTDELTLEGEFGQSSSDNSQRVLAEYAPYWGRIFLSYKRIGDDYVRPSSFYLLRNYRETNFITDYRPTKKLALTMNYQLTQFGPDDLLLAEKNTVNRVTFTSLYQADDATSYIASGTYSHSESASSPQDNERIEFTVQKSFKETGDQAYAQFFQQYQKSNYLSQYNRRMGGGTDLRYSKKFSSRFDGDLQTAFQLNDVKNTFLTTSSSFQSYLETVISWGPSINYNLDKQVFTAGLNENFTFKNAFQDFSHFLLPFGSAYYNPSDALSFGMRANFNFDPGNDYSYISILAEFIYKFGSKVPTTLFSTFKSTGEVSGVVFEDANNDGEYQSNEKLITGAVTQLNSQGNVRTTEGKFKYKVSTGENTVMVILPKEYENYQFMVNNPTSVDIVNGETKKFNFGVNRRIPISGKVVVREMEKSGPVDFGFAGARIEITGENYKDVVETTQSGMFNTSVTHPGNYKAKLLLLELPMGYKSVGSTTIDFTVTEGVVTKLDPIVLNARRVIAGRVFFDVNTDGMFDENDEPIGGIKIQIGDTVNVSEEDGSFSVTTLKPGIYKLKVSPWNYKKNRLNMPTDTVTVPDAGTVQVHLPYQK